MKKFYFTVLVLLTTVAGFAQPQKIVADKIVAVVGDRIVLQSDVLNSISDIMRKGGTVPPNAECALLEQMMVSKILMLQAMKDSLVVTDEEVEAELDQRMRYYINEFGSKEAVEQVAGKSIYQIKEEARETVRENKLAQAMHRKIVENVRITPAEVKAYFNRIPVDSLPFFETEVEIGQIVVLPKASRELEKYVMDELANYKRQIEAKLITFAQAAQKYSEDPGSKENGGQYQINRTDKAWDPAFVAAAFRLKDGEISPVFKSKFGYHIVQMVQRSGDDALVRHILRIPPVTEDEIRQGIAKLDSIRAKIIAGNMSFNTAAGKYSEDETAKYAGPLMISRDGDTFLNIDELDKDVVAQLDKLKVGELSQPYAYVDERGRRAVRVLFLKSRSEPHRMNLRDDYNRISQAALEEKKMLTLEKWFTTNLPRFYVQIDPDLADCVQLKKWVEVQKTYASN
ncbi:MAG TPA: peptidylprolyl isomerase [Flavisolibacter sp.]